MIEEPKEELFKFVESHLCSKIDGKFRSIFQQRLLRLTMDAAKMGPLSRSKAIPILCPKSPLFENRVMMMISVGSFVSQMRGRCFRVIRVDDDPWHASTAIRKNVE